MHCELHDVALEIITVKGNDGCEVEYVEFILGTVSDIEMI